MYKSAFGYKALTDARNSVITDAFLRLFVSRADAYAVQQPAGYLKVDRPLTAEVVQRHLKGEITIGLYQLDGANNVKWLVFDLDPEKLEKPLETAKAIIRECVLKPDPKKPRFWKKAVLLESSRYPDPSYHIWILFEPVPIPAKAARWLALRILEFANVNPKHVEVFPKQVELTENGYGNLVKAPLGLHRAAKKWSFFLDLETLRPLPHDYIRNVRGVSFSEADIDAICSFQEKKQVQLKLELPTHARTLSEKDESWIAEWLAKRWIPGYRNQLELSFLGLCIKRGVAYESARRIIDKVTEITKDEEKQRRLQLAKYHYERRAHRVRLKGTSGLKELLRFLRSSKDGRDKGNSGKN